MKPLVMVGLPAIALALVSATLFSRQALAQDEKPTQAVDQAAQCIEFSPKFTGFETITADSGGMSLTTGELLTETSRYLSVYVEGFDGRRHAAFSPSPQGMFIFTTTSGQYVVRFLHWPSAH